MVVCPSVLVLVQVTWYLYLRPELMQSFEIVSSDEEESGVEVIAISAGVGSPRTNPEPGPHEDPVPAGLPAAGSASVFPPPPVCLDGLSTEGFLSHGYGLLPPDLATPHHPSVVRWGAPHGRPFPAGWVDPNMSLRDLPFLPGTGCLWFNPAVCGFYRAARFRPEYQHHLEWCPCRPWGHPLRHWRWWKTGGEIPFWSTLGANVAGLPFFRPLGRPAVSCRLDELNDYPLPAGVAMPPLVDRGSPVSERERAHHLAAQNVVQACLDAPGLLHGMPAELELPVSSRVSSADSLGSPDKPPTPPPGLSGSDAGRDDGDFVEDFLVQGLDGRMFDPGLCSYYRRTVPPPAGFYWCPCTPFGEPGSHLAWPLGLAFRHLAAGSRAGVCIDVDEVAGGDGADADDEGLGCEATDSADSDAGVVFDLDAA